MNDDLNLKELSRIYHAAKDIENPSPPAITHAIDLFPKRSHHIRWHRGYAFAIAAALIVLLCLFVSVRLALEANPNTLLYQLKRTSESARIALASSPQERLELHLLFAEERIEEGSQVTNDPYAALVALDEYKKELAQVSALINAQDDDAVNQSLAMVVDELGDNAVELTELAQDPPGQGHTLLYRQVVQAMESTQAVLTMTAKKEMRTKPFNAVKAVTCVEFEDAEMEEFASAEPGGKFDEYEDAWSLLPIQFKRDCQ